MKDGGGGGKVGGKDKSRGKEGKRGGSGERRRDVGGREGKERGRVTDREE